MNDRHFWAMVALAMLSSITCLFGTPSAAVFPALMLFVIGFDAIATEVKKAERND